MNLYTYDGPVFEFDRLIVDHWIASTRAVSEKKARCNLAYQFKIQNSRLPHTKITVPGKITIVEGDDRYSG